MKLNNFYPKRNINDILNVFFSVMTCINFEKKNIINIFVLDVEQFFKYINDVLEFCTSGIIFGRFRTNLFFCKGALRDKTFYLKDVIHKKVTFLRKKNGKTLRTKKAFIRIP